ncbi:hypothetical protein GCM10011409_07540 [Lentibacillus populi]|uniref:HTH cro/C1-type domain-containing protein n=1 Tax=Lentibacillus populi TaxID=1827502 RepID=A0A9W5TUT8_9BACI|nr:helix-turn-helix transcriptional regulator [Lentibacillus populi]MBT2216787.1 helix-turn-helix transcriptional regulator [Virgibacillus dakarensis]GGB32623.1 hypothetical protein GCM10011409_07540 [Lentibacillus populi]
MKIGTIIKYYRKRKGWTQEELGKGICSVAHLSKIEKDTTKFSEVTTNLLCERLGIRAEEEIERFKNVNNELHQLHEMIVKHQMETFKTKLDKLTNSPFIHMDVFRPFFLLLWCRYYLRVGNMDNFNNVMAELDEKYPTLQKFECNMKEHVKGIEEGLKGHYPKALEHLMNIDANEYSNHEFYYHVACNSYFINNQGKTLFYANKALDYFKQTNNYKRIMDTESLLLLHMETNGIYNFDEAVEGYRKLIQTCDIYGDYFEQCIISNNLAFTYFKKKDFEMAQTIYEEAKELSVKIENTGLYVRSLIGQVHSRLLQNDPITAKETVKWSHLIKEGMSLSEDNETNKLYFQLLTFLLEDQKPLYYDYLHHELIPHLKENGDLFTARFYSKETYQYYLSIKELDTAAKLAMSMVDEESK